MSDELGNSMARTCTNDRRGAHRYKLDWPVRLTTGSARDTLTEVATLRNLSSTGALLVLKSNPTLGERVSIFVKIPFEKEEWMSYSATVVRITNDSTSLSVALKFDTSRPRFALFKPSDFDHNDRSVEVLT
jgi:c-di-GMP-binding flagellar brake protein YcgR